MLKRQGDRVDPDRPTACGAREALRHDAGADDQELVVTSVSSSGVQVQAVGSAR